MLAAVATPRNGDNGPFDIDIADDGKPDDNMDVTAAFILLGLRRAAGWANLPLEGLALGEMRVRGALNWLLMSCRAGRGACAFVVDAATVVVSGTEAVGSDAAAAGAEVFCAMFMAFS